MDYIEDIVQPEEFGILDIFRGTEYIVPIYQRNYAWEKDQIEQLLNDINDTTGKYYLGSLIVNQRSASSFEVIDGQQRLTTLFLLLSYLNDESVKRNSLKFEAREKSNKTLTEINKIKNTTDQLEKETWFSEEIIEGYSRIVEYFESHNEKDKSFMDSFIQKLSNITIIRTQVPKKIDLNHYFEIMNTRGEQLELHEIVKANILSAITSSEDKNIAAIIWDACAQMDKYVQMCFDKERREKIFGSEWTDFNYKNFDELRPKFEGAQSLYENRFTLLSKLQNPGKIDKSRKPNDKIEENERFESIISFPNFLLQVNEAMNVIDTEDDAGLDDKKFISLLQPHYKPVDENTKNDTALAFVFSLLKYRVLFDKYIIKREYARDYKTEGKWSLQRLEMYVDAKGKKPVYKGTYNSNDDDNANTSLLRLLQSCLRITYTSPKTMHWISKSLSELGKNESVDLIKILEDYSCKKVQSSGYKTSKGFGIDRIVFTYLDYILCRDNSSSYGNFQFQFRTSIEHFHPQNPINKDIWEDKYLNCFGNLALITVSANSKFSNLLPHQKTEDYPENIEQSPKLMKMRDLMKMNNGKWERTTAESHESEMIALLEDELTSHGCAK